MPSCSCCGEVGRTVTGCSCRGGKSHTCRKASGAGANGVRVAAATPGRGLPQRVAAEDGDADVDALTDRLARTRLADSHSPSAVLLASSIRRSRSALRAGGSGAAEASSGAAEASGGHRSDRGGAALEAERRGGHRLAISSDYSGFKSWKQVDSIIVSGLSCLDNADLPVVNVVAGVPGAGKSHYARRACGARPLTAPDGFEGSREAIEAIGEEIAAAGEVTFEIGGTGSLDAYERLLVLVERSGGRSTYLDVPQETVERQRRHRLEKKDSSDPDRRSEAQLMGTLRAPLSAPSFLGALRERMPSLRVLQEVPHSEAAAVDA